MRGSMELGLKGGGVRCANVTAGSAGEVAFGGSTVHSRRTLLWSSMGRIAGPAPRDTSSTAMRAHSELEARGRGSGTHGSLNVSRVAGAQCREVTLSAQRRAQCARASCRSRANAFDDRASASAVCSFDRPPNLRSDAFGRPALLGVNA